MIIGVKTRIMKERDLQLNPKQDEYIRKEAAEITKIPARTIQY
jgi:hypothetical protein